MHIGNTENSIQRCLGLGRDIPSVHCNTQLALFPVETSQFPALNQHVTSESLEGRLQCWSLWPVALNLRPLL